jgi:hypothetical protein
MVPVGLVEGPAGDAGPPQVVQALEELALAGNATDDQVGMGQMLRDEKPCRFDGRVARLDDLLRTGKVVPHEDVDIGRFVVLREFHPSFLQNAGTFFNPLLKSRIERRTSKDQVGSD